MILLGVEKVLKSAHRPLTSEEIVARVKDKNRGNVFVELRKLRKNKLIVKLDVRLAITETELSNPIILYRWIGE